VVVGVEAHLKAKTHVRKFSVTTPPSREETEQSRKGNKERGGGSRR